MSVICERDGGDLARTRRLGGVRFEHAVRREITRRGGQKPALRIVRALFTALADPAGVTVHRGGALERVMFLSNSPVTRLGGDHEGRRAGVHLGHTIPLRPASATHGSGPGRPLVATAKPGDPVRRSRRSAASRAREGSN